MTNIRTLADIGELEAVPLSARHWPTSTFDLLRRGAERWPDQPALTIIEDPRAFQASRSVTFEELLRGVTSMANLLGELGVGPTEVTAYLLPNLLETHIALWGAEAAGIAFPLSPLLSPDHLVALLNQARVRVLVTAPAASDVDWMGWEALRPHLQHCPSLRHVLLTPASGAPLTDVASDADEGFSVRLLHSELARQNPSSLASRRVFGAEDPSSYFCTGGTTGLPKIAVRTHAAEAVNAGMLALSLGDELAEGSKSLCGLPLFHVNAATVTGLTTWFNGGEVVLAGRGYRDPAVIANFWAIISHYRINFFSAVPTILSTLLESPVTSDVGSLRFAICGAAPLPTELFNRFEETTGLKVLEGYGLTESTCVASMNPVGGQRRVGSVGFRMPYQEMRSVITDEAGQYVRDCEVDEVGAIALAGPNLFRGYTDPDHERGVWLDLGDGRRWMNTGDLGRQDRDGYFWLTGRRKELIIRGGHNIDPRLIEEAMHRHPAVALAAAVGRPHARLGEVPVVYVEPRAGLSPTADELAEHAAREISDRAATPVEVIVLPALPKTPVGKLSKIELVNREVQRVVEGEAARLGLELIELSVSATPQGVVATVRTGGPADELAHRLRAYTFQTRVS